MPGPSSDSTTDQARGPATAEEAIAGRYALGQSALSGQAARLGLTSARSMLANADVELRSYDDRVAQLEQQAAALSREFVGRYDDPAFRQQANTINSQIQTEQESKARFKGMIPELRERAQTEQEQSQLSLTATKRLLGVLSGEDFGVSAREQELITQGISGISQDVATTRGLNRTDVPVMQAIAPTVASSLLEQANRNRSLFTGINQFQQGMDLSGRQLQLGLAGQNPAANLTGVYAGLRPSSFSTNTRQGYGALDYVNAGAGLAKGIGALAAAGGGGGTTNPLPEGQTPNSMGW